MKLSRFVLIVSVAVLAMSCRGEGDPTYRVETLVAGSSLHSPNGITFGPDGKLYAGSVSAQTIYRIDVDTGQIEVVVPAPDGEADDIAFAPDGTMFWTALIGGEIRALREDGSVAVVAADMKLINPVRFTKDGRLFAAQMGFDRLYEFSPDGTEEPRLVASKIGNLNSFEIAADDRLYGPLPNHGTVAQIDIDTGEVMPIARDLGAVVAVALDAAGSVWAVNWQSGDLWRIEPAANGWKEPVRVTTLQSPLDNLAVGPEGYIYVSRTAYSAIDRVDPDTGEQQSVVDGQLAAAGGIAITNHGGREVLLVADGFGYRIVDTQTGKVSSTHDLTVFGFPGAASDAAASSEYFALTDAATRPRVYLVERASGKTVGSWKGFEAPYGIVLRSNGDPIVADFASGTLVGLSRTDKKQRDVIAEGLEGPVGIAWDGTDAVYVTEAVGGRLTRVSLADGMSSVVADELMQPEGTTVLADGRIAVVEVGRQRLVAIDPASGEMAVLADKLPVGDPRAGAPPPVYLPSGVAQGADGSLYVSGDIDNSIVKVVRERRTSTTE